MKTRDALPLAGIVAGALGCTEEPVAAWAHGIRIARVDAASGVAVPLSIGDRPASPEERAAPLPPGRDTYLLLHVDVDSDWEPRPIEATFEIETAAGQRFETRQVRTIRRSTSAWAVDPAGGRRFGLALDDFEGFFAGIEAPYVTPDLAWRVSLREVEGSGETGATAPTAVPADALWPMGIEQVERVLRIDLVPFALSQPGCQRSADVSEAAMAPLLAHLSSMFPVTRVEAVAAAPLPWTDALDRTPMSEALTVSRTERGLPPDVYTYGIVEACPGVDPMEPPGGAYSSPASVPDVAAAPFLSALLMRNDYQLYGDFPYEQYVFTHELAHLLGRAHAPCGFPRAPDPSYPDDGGRIGQWGVDTLGRRLFHPELSHDLMAYCQAMWISPYTWQGLDRRMEAQGKAYAVGPGGASPQAAPGDVLLGFIDPSGESRWRAVREPRALSRTGEGRIVLGRDDGTQHEIAAAVVELEGGGVGVAATLPPDRSVIASARLEHAGRVDVVPIEAVRGGAEVSR